MSDTGITRRSIMGGAAGALALGAAARAVAAPARLDLADPLQRARARAKIIGSVAEETIVTLYRLNIYGYLNDGNLIPFFTMNNLNITRWKPLPNGHHLGTTVEAGVYCRFDSDEVLDVWDNPVTHEKRPVWEFLGGPYGAEMGPDGIVTRGAGLHPHSLRMEVLGEMIFVPTASGSASPNPMTPQQWPTQSAGPVRYWESQATFAAKLADVANPDLSSAPAFCQFQNFGTFHPWLGMGNRPGRTYGKAHGAKFASLDALPLAVRAGFEKKTPDIFDYENWKTPHRELEEYMATQKPG